MPVSGLVKAATVYGCSFSRRSETFVRAAYAHVLCLARGGGQARTRAFLGRSLCWAEARIKIARMTLTIKLDGNWSSFQLANSAPPLSVTDSAIAPSARMPYTCLQQLLDLASKEQW